MTGRFSFDTNILVYAHDRAAGTRHERAREIVARAAWADCILTQQVVGEFLNVGRRRFETEPDLVETAVAGLTHVFSLAATPLAALIEAFRRAQRYRLQFWDSVITTVCIANSVETLISEDMHDGMDVDGVTIINPFQPSNAEQLRALLTPSGS